MAEPNQIALESITHEKRYALIEKATMVFLIILSMIGISIMDFSPAEGYQYWVGMIPIFGIGAIVINFAQTKQSGPDVQTIFIEQLRLWFGAFLALCGTLLLLHSNALNDENTGLVMLLILSLATYIDGIRIGWRFGLLGNFLGLTAVTIAYLENFMWILFGLAAITIGLIIFWHRHSSKA